VLLHLYFRLAGADAASTTVTVSDSSASVKTFVAFFWKRYNTLLSGTAGTGEKMLYERYICSPSSAPTDSVTSNGELKSIYRRKSVDTITLTNFATITTWAALLNLLELTNLPVSMMHPHKSVLLALYIAIIDQVVATSNASTNNDTASLSRSL